MPGTKCKRRGAAFVRVEPLERRTLLSATFYVSTHGSDANAGTDPTQPWRHIQKAFDSATPGSTVNIEPGTYKEKLTLNVSGTAAAGYTTFQAAGPLGSVVISGRNKPGHNILYINGRSYVRIVGFDIRDDQTRDGSGIRIEGAAGFVQLLGNRIHRIHGTDAMGITVYGSSPAEGIHDLTIDGNEVYDCQAAHSEALTLNGNVYRFAVTNNFVHNVNNIGIDFIGGEGMSPDPSTDTARDGVCSGNRVSKARSSYGGGYAAGIYIDGGQNIIVERNTVWRNDLGIEVGCEHAGRVASGDVVRDNLIFDNYQGGLVFGGYDAGVGRVMNCQFLNNTLYHDDRLKQGNGELWVQYASGNVIRNNLISGNNRGLLINAGAGATNNTSDYNLLFVGAGPEPGAAKFVWDGVKYGRFADYLAGSGQDAQSAFADPRLNRPVAGDFRLAANSPAIDAGDPSFSPAPGETDINGHPRLQGGRTDIGADEA